VPSGSKLSPSENNIMPWYAGTSSHQFISSELFISTDFFQHENYQIYGDFVDVSNDHPYVLAHTRSLEGSTLLVMLNFSDQEVDFHIPSISPPLRLLLGNYGDELPSALAIKYYHLRGYEGRVYLL